MVLERMESPEKRPRPRARLAESPVEADPLPWPELDFGALDASQEDMLAA